MEYRKLSFDYLNFYILVQKNLNVHNVEHLKRRNLDNIAKLYPTEVFSDYKKNLFWQWHKINYEQSEFYISRFLKLAKKLNIKFNYLERDFINNMYDILLTKNRTLKQLENPELTNKYQLHDFSYFIFKNVHYYYENGNFLKKQDISELFLTPTEIFFYKRDLDQILMFIKIDDIITITLTNYSIIISHNDKNAKGKKLIKNTHLRYKNNPTIFLAFQKVWKKKGKVTFKLSNFYRNPIPDFPLLTFFISDN